MLKGIIAALVTPLKESEELDLDALERIVERVVVGGVHGILVLGSQGEFYALSAREQHEVVLAAVQAASGRVPVYAGTSAITTREAVRLAKRAERCGVTGVSALPPFFVRPSRGELHAHYVSIASAIDVPVIAYNQPRFTGITLEAGLIADLALASAVVGIKASGDFGQALEYLAACPADFAVLLGNDGQIAYGLIAGAQGAVAASANVFPELCVQIYDAIAAGDTTKA
jgi:4-hydroxy-tetrahydrodipicolinate synthase